MISTEEEDIIEIFDRWCKHYTEVTCQLTEIEEKLKQAEKQIETLTETNNRLRSECSLLQETVSQCQQQLQTVCDLEAEVHCLKQQITDKDQALRAESIQNKVITEDLRKAHEAEKKTIITNIKAEYDKKLGDIDNQLRAEIEAKNSLLSIIEDVKRDKDREISRVSQEYESKLTKAHRQKAQYMQQQQQLLNQDIMRKKMQCMKENYEQDIAALKSQIEDFEQKFQLVHDGKQVKDNYIQVYGQQPQKNSLHEMQQHHERTRVGFQDKKNVMKYS